VLTRCCVISPKSTQTDRFSLQYLFWLFLTNQKSPLLTGDPELTMNRWTLSTKSLSLSLSPPLTIIFFLLDLILIGWLCKEIHADCYLRQLHSPLSPPSPNSFFFHDLLFFLFLMACLIFMWPRLKLKESTSYKYNSWWPSVVAVHTFLRRLQTIYHQASHGCLVLTSIPSSFLLWQN